MERKIILNLAISLDGYIARKDGSFDWIKGDGDKSNDTEKEFDFTEFVKTLDIIVMGKKAFLDLPKGTIKMFKEQKIYVASNKKLETEHNVEFISGDIVKKIQELKKEEGKDIWLFGGSGSIDPFIKANAIDEYIIGVIPIILGDGIPLFLNNNPSIELQLMECTVKEGVTMIKYAKR
jgi:dihydrofolate reductase